jgi:pantetheine-phosphate adenylyltransferase
MGASRAALFAGTFDPPTLGHLDLIRRASALFEKLTVAVAVNPTKQALLPVEVRLDLLRRICAGTPGVEVRSLEGLVVDAARAAGAGVLVRGVRHAGDFEFEAQMARTNRAIHDGIETMLLVSAPEHVHISSTLVRQIAGLGGDLSGLVPGEVARALRSRGAS